MLNICANISWLFREHEFVDRFAAAREAGFTGVEFHDPEGVDPATVARAARNAGVTIALFNASLGDFVEGGPGLSGVPGREEEFRTVVGEACEFGEGIGGGAVVQIGPSRVPEGTSRSQCFDVYVENLRYAAACLEQVNCLAMVEPMNTVDLPGVLIPDAVAGLDAIQAAATKNLGLQFDTYHDRMAGRDVYASMRELAGKMRHVQFSDVPGRHEPGTGSLDVQEVFRILDQQGYEHWVGGEYRPTGSTEASLAWLNKYRESVERRRPSGT